MSDKPRYYATGGNTTPPLPVEQGAAYWRERYEIERGEVEAKDAEIARLKAELEATHELRIRQQAISLMELPQAQAERDALAAAVRHHIGADHAISASCDGCRLACRMRRWVNRVPRRQEAASRPRPCPYCCVGEDSLHGATLRAMGVQHCDCKT